MATRPIRYRMRGLKGMVAGISSHIVSPDHAALAENVNLDTVGVVASRSGTKIYADSTAIKDFGTSNAARVVAMRRVYVADDVKTFLICNDNHLIAPQAGTVATEDSGDFTRTYSPLSSDRPNNVNIFAPPGIQFQWASGDETCTVAYTGSTNNTSTHRPQIFQVTSGNIKDPVFISGSDNQYCILNEPKQNNYCAVLCRDWRMDSDLPDNVTVQGIAVNLEGLFATSSSATIKNIQLGNFDSSFSGTGSRDGTAKAITNTTTEGTVTYGGSADLWGLTTTTCTPSYLRSSQFFVYVDYLDSTGAHQLKIDDLNVVVYFTGGSNANLTKNLKQGDFVDNDATTLPVTQANGIESVTNATTFEHVSSAGSNSTNNTSYFVRLMQNQIGTVIEPVAKQRRVVIANGNDVPWEFGIQNSSFGILGNSAPTAAPTLATAGGTALIAPGTYIYKYTFRSEFGESNASTTAQITLAASDNVSVSALELGPNKVFYRDVYRTTNGGTTYYRVQRVSNNSSTSFTDSMTDASLTAQTAFDELDRSSPGKFRVVRWHQNRMWGFVDGDDKLYYSNLDKPDEWDVSNYIPLREQPRNMMPIGEGLALYTSRSITMVHGRSVESFVPQETENNVGLYGRWTLQQIDKNTQIFLSRDGLRIFNGIRSQRLSGIEADILFSDDSPPQGEVDYRMNRTYVDNAVAHYWRNKYILVYPSTGNEFANRVLIYDFDANSVTVMRSPTFRTFLGSSDTGDTDQYYSITSWGGPNDQDSLMIGGSQRVWRLFTGTSIEDPEKYTGPSTVQDWNIRTRWHSQNMNCDFDGDKLFKAAHLWVDATAGKMKVDTYIDRVKTDSTFTMDFQDVSGVRVITVPIPQTSPPRGQEIQIRIEYTGQAKWKLEAIDIDFEVDEAYLDYARVS